jgi:hypothetical protein
MVTRTQRTPAHEHTRSRASSDTRRSAGAHWHAAAARTAHALAGGLPIGMCPGMSQGKPGVAQRQPVLTAWPGA